MHHHKPDAHKKSHTDHDDQLLQIHPGIFHFPNQTQIDHSPPNVSLI